MPAAWDVARTRPGSGAARPPETPGRAPDAQTPSEKWRAFDPRDEDEGMTAAAPTVHQACWPLTSYSAREPDPGSPVSNLLESNVRVRFRDRRPRDLLVRSRVGVGRNVRL